MEPNPLRNPPSLLAAMFSFPLMRIEPCFCTIVKQNLPSRKSSTMAAIRKCGQHRYSSFRYQPARG